LDDNNWPEKVQALAHPTKKNLLIVDDQIKNKPLMRLLCNMIMTASQPSRDTPHLHMWIISQRWEGGIPLDIRLNVFFCVFFFLAITGFGQEFIGTGRSAIVKWGERTFKPFQRIIRLAVRQRYDFLTANMNKFDESGKS
jgi:hypothetical protein